MRQSKKSSLLLILFLSSSLNGMDFVPRIKSFLEEHLALTVSFCGAASLGFYFLYTYILPNTKRRIRSISHVNDITPVKTLKPEQHADSFGNGLERVLTRYESKINLTPGEKANAQEKELVAELWQCLRAEYMAHYFAFNSREGEGNRLSTIFPREVQNRIASFLMRINNPSLFRSPQEEFASTLLNYTIYLHNNQVRWLLPAKGKFTQDKKYYVVKGEDRVCIYNFETKKIIKEVVGCNRFILLQSRNVVVCYRGEKYQENRQNIRFYDIENDIDVPYLDIDYTFKKLKISRDGNYLFGCSGTNIFLCDIQNIKKINTFEASYEHISDVALSDDNELFAANTGNGIRLLKLNAEGLHEVSAYEDYADDNMLSWCDIRFFDNNYLMATYSSRRDEMCLNLQITQYGNNEVTMTKTLNSGKYNAYWHQLASGSRSKISNKIFIYQQRNLDPDNDTYDPVLKITTVNGDVLHQMKGSLYRCALSEDEKHISLSCGNNPHNSIIVHLSDEPRFLSQQFVSADPKESPAFTGFNPQSTLMKQYSRIRDLNGVTVKTFDSLHTVRFHHQGNAIIDNDTLHELYPFGADSCWKNKTEKMSIAQYCAMQKVGRAIGIINKNKDIARANERIEYDAKKKAEAEEFKRQHQAQYEASLLT